MYTGDQLESELEAAAPEVGLEDNVEVDQFSQEFIDSLVAKILVFIEELVGHDFYPYQRQISARIIESIVIGDGATITVLAARQSGKALALDTPLLTTSGWKTMGTVEIGDEVFAPDGSPTKILTTSETFHGHDCFEVEFADGQKITADADHLWTVWDLKEKREVTLTTRQMLDTWQGTDARFNYRYRIPMPAPIQRPEVDLPIDPYLLGLWLGDGSSSKTEITTSEPEVVEYPTGKAVTYGIPGGFMRALRDLDMLGHRSAGKFIPEQYLLASEAQRRALLAGLVDTDGYAQASAVEFSSTSRQLSEGVLFLARSLGWKTVLHEKRAMLNGKDCGPSYRVTWSAWKDNAPFTLERKASRLRDRPSDQHRIDRTCSLSITGVTPVESVPTRCIGVAHPSHLFLAGKGLVPTHNTESLANTLAGLMILLPRLAKIFPDLLGKFSRGFWVGCFAPVEGQVETLYGRIVDRLTSDTALEIMRDPEIDDQPDGKGKYLKLTRSGSFVRMQTANPRAKIESKTYHVLVGDEAQGIDDFVWRKSISPMAAVFNGTRVMTGTPTTHKGVFFSQIQLNKRQQLRRGARQNHYEFNWRYCAKSNPNYAKFIRSEILNIGEDSDEFQLSYDLRWLLDRGMFVTPTRLDELGDVSMEIVRSWYKSPVVVGVDPARSVDSTVVTVVWVGWNNPDEFGYYPHRILNWLEIQGEDWEAQYYQILRFLSNYSVFQVGVDSQGVGDAVAQRLSVLMPGTEVISLPSDPASQTERWLHLQQLINRGRIGWPAHAKTRRLKVWKRFRQQMEDLEKVYRGKYLLAQAPNEKNAHDDHPDALALATILTKDFTLPEVEVSESPFVGRRR